MRHRTVNSEVVGNLFRESKNKGEGARKVIGYIDHLITPKDEGGEGLHMENFSLRNLAIELDVMDPKDMSGSLRRNMGMEADGISGHVMSESLFSEANPGVNTTLFKKMTSDLIHSSVIEGYDKEEGYIGAFLVETLPGQTLINQKITGTTSLAGPTEVQEGFPYQESGFEEKFITTKETKRGRILSLTEELFVLDQTGEVARRARNLGFWTRQSRERVIVRGVIDADASTDPVFRPSGTGETLYNTDGSNKNFIGSGNTTDSGFNAAIPLVDFTDVDTARNYRAVAPKDDRIDGTQLPIAGLNGNNILLVPDALVATANNIRRSTTSQIVDNQANAATNRSMFPTPDLVNGVLSSPFIDDEGGENVNDWYYGQPNRQFIWTEIWPVQTFVQNADSESAFERDTVFRIKVRYWGGISATDSIWFTKIDGN